MDHGPAVMPVREGNFEMTRMKFVMAALATVALAGPAAGQAINLVSPDKQLTNEEIEKQKAIDRAYKDAISKLPDQQRSNDPWANVRAVDQSAPKPAAKPAPKTAAKPTHNKNADAKPLPLR